MPHGGCCARIDSKRRKRPHFSGSESRAAMTHDSVLRSFISFGRRHGLMRCYELTDGSVSALAGTARVVASRTVIRLSRLTRWPPFMDICGAREVVSADRYLLR